MEPRLNPATGRPFDLGYNQVFLDPATGEVNGRRFWGRVSLHRQALLPFLYKLHYTMHLPDFFGVGGLGIWLMGIVGIVWTFDCFVGLCLTLPNFKKRDPSMKSWLKRWSPAWKVKVPASPYRMSWDVHRAAGLWAWLFILILAFTSISMNLGEQVVKPLLSRVFTLTPEASEIRHHQPAMLPPIPFAAIVKVATDEATRLKWTEPAGSIFFNSLAGVYSVSFFTPDAERVRGLEPKTLYIDGTTGAVLGKNIPWAGTFADVFMQLQFPLHSGRIAGTPGRILLSIMGVIVASLSFTGIVIWFRKRLARQHRVEVWQRSRSVPGFERYGLLDEACLRQRVAGLGQAAIGAAGAERQIRLSSIAVLIVPMVVVLLSVCLIGIARVYRAVSLQARLASRPARETLAIIYRRQFWLGAWWDVRCYVRKLGEFGARLLAPLSRKL